MSLERAIARDPFDAFPTPWTTREASDDGDARRETHARARRRSVIASWNVGLRGWRAMTDASRSRARAVDAHGQTRSVPRRGTLRALGADVRVACVQETKMSRLDFERRGREADWDCAHSACDARDKRSGYSGVAIYWRSRETCPVAIEEGVCGTRTKAESAIWPNERPPLVDEDYARAKALDDEGRAIWADFGEFVLCNLYAPTTYGAVDEKVAERIDFKRDFLRALEERLTSLRSRGRRVIMCGDWNIAPNWKLDRAHDDPRAVEPKNESREWLTRVLGQDGMCDVFREVHPNVKAFTCWNVASGAQINDYGSRIDYFLCDRDTLGHVQGVGVAQKFEGSDHAPIFLDLDDAMWRERTAHQQPPPLAMSVLYPGRQTTVIDHFAPSKVSGTTGISTLDAEDISKSRALKRAPEPPKRKVAETTLKDFFTVKSSKKKMNEPVTPGESKSVDAEVNDPDVETTVKKVNDYDAQAALWSNTLAKMAPPKCAGHGETCKVRVVKKRESPHFARVFFCCPRPAGPRTNPACDCGFFAWRDDRRSK